MTDLAPTPRTLASEGKQRILDEAAVLFQRQGYAETSLRDIAAAAGMKAGSLYYHFESKDDLFTAVLAHGIAVMVDAFDDASDAALPGRDRLAAHVTAHLRTLYDNGAYTVAHVTAFRNAPDSVRTAIVPLRDAYEARWTELLDELLPGRQRRDLTILRLILFGAMNASVEWFDAGRGSLATFADAVTDQFWTGATSLTVKGH